MSETAPETPPTEELETKVEETETKLEEAQANPEYASKADVTKLTEMLEGFRAELAEAKKTPKPKVEPPAKKETPKTEEKPKEETPKVEEKPEEKAYGSSRWFNRKAKVSKS